MGIVLIHFASVAAGSKRADRDDRVNALGGAEPCGAGTPLANECAEIEDLDSEARTFDAVAIAGFVAAGISMGATLAYVLWPREEAVERQGVVVAPAVARQGGMLVLSGAF